MEEDLTKNKSQLKRILVSGPESSGKTALVSHLAARFKGVAVEEYARTYVEGLNRPYTFEDVEHIAMQQMASYQQDFSGSEWVFFDTWLIISRVWFEVVFKKIPPWIDTAIKGAVFDLVLLCAPDIPWVPDGVRENGGKEREELFEKYKLELDRFGMDWELVKGNGEERFELAERIIYRKTGYVTI